MVTWSATELSIADFTYWSNSLQAAGLKVCKMIGVH